MITDQLTKNYLKSVHTTHCVRFICEDNTVTGWIGTVEVNRDMGLKLGEKQRQNVSPGSSPAS